MKTIFINIGEYAATRDPQVVLKTVALGSCVALIFFDPITKIAAMAHIALPDSKLNPKDAQIEPGRYADTAITALIQDMAENGFCGDIRKLTVKLIGGARVGGPDPGFNVGQKNIAAIKELLKKRGMCISVEEVGGTISRTVIVEPITGAAQIISPEMKARVI